MKLKLFLILFFIARAIQSQTWIRQNDLPASLRDGAMSFSIGNKGYIVAGRGNISVQYDTWEWDMQSDTWAKKANFPGGKRYFGCGFSLGTKGYVTCGFDGNWSTNDLWEYDPATDAWTRKNDFPSTPRHHAVCFTIGNKAYFGTGWCDTSYTALKDFWEWDQTNDTWTRIADFGGGPRQGASAFSIGTKGYVGCGESFFDPYIGSVIQKDFWEWNQSTNTWTRKQDYGGLPAYHGSGFSIGYSGYMGFGINNQNRVTQEMWEWDSQLEQWTQKTTIPSCERFCGSAFAIGSSGFILLGTDSCGKRDLWEMNLNTLTPDKEIADNDFLKIWPNPTDGSVTISSSSKINRIEILNSTGQTIKELTPQEGTKKIIFETPGHYFLKITHEKSVHVEKVLVIGE
ncbi:MAG: kelch repeat-containing protein [Bacteroidia bacterium]